MNAPFQKSSPIPKDSQCFGCGGLCCNPVSIQMEIDVPLPPNHQDQFAEDEDIVAALAYTAIEGRARLERCMQKSLDERQTLKGVLIIDEDRKQIIQNQGIAFIRAKMFLQFQCSLFVEDEGVCGDYKSRPPTCKKSLLNCTMSPKAMTEGENEDHRALLKAVSGLGEPDIETALFLYFKKIACVS